MEKINKTPKPLSKTTAEEAEVFSVGLVIEHRVFGKGKIRSITGLTAVVLFDTGAVRTLNLKLAPVTIPPQLIDQPLPS